MVWLVGGLLLLAFLLIVLAVGVFGTAEKNDGGLVAVIPLSGKGDQAEIFDREGHRKGYGIRRPDGSWDFFHEDGSRLGVVAKPEMIEKQTSNEGARVILQPRREK